MSKYYIVIDSITKKQLVSNDIPICEPISMHESGEVQMNPYFIYVEAPDDFDSDSKIPYYLDKNNQLILMDKNYFNAKILAEKLSLLKDKKREELALALKKAKVIKLYYTDSNNNTLEVSDDIENCQNIMIRKFANGEFFDYDIYEAGISLKNISKEVANTLQSKCETTRTNLKAFENFYKQQIDLAATIEEINNLEFKTIKLRGEDFGIDEPFTYKVANTNLEFPIQVMKTYE